MTSVTGTPSVSTTGGRLSSDHENFNLYLPSLTSSQGSGLRVLRLGFLSLDSAHLRTSDLSVSSLSTISLSTIADKEYPNLLGASIAWNPSSVTGLSVVWMVRAIT